MEEEALCLDCEDPDAKQLTEAKAARLSPAEPEPVELAPVASASSRGTTTAAAEAARERREATRRILRFMVMKKQESWHKLPSVDRDFRSRHLGVGCGQFADQNANAHDVRSGLGVVGRGSNG